MFEGYIQRKVDERLNEILGESIKDGVDKYVKDLLRSAVVAEEAADIVTSPGTDYVLYVYNPRTPTTIGGYIDFRGMGGEDVFKVKCEVKLTKDHKWAKYFEHTLTGMQADPIFSFQEMVIMGGIRITMTHTSGVGKKITHLWYKRK